MPFNDGIDKKFCFSLTDFHDFDRCHFLFCVKHYLNKKYEIEEGNENLALGSLLDVSIKLLHSLKAYGQPTSNINKIVKQAAINISQKVNRHSGPSFYSSILPFLNQPLIDKASAIFQKYYEGLGGKIKYSLAEVGFCEWIINDDDKFYKLWGGPDTIEMGDDGVPEVVDYKYQSSKNNNIDMDLMPKIYLLLSLKKLMNQRYHQARFIVRFWQDPLNNSFSQDFNLTKVFEFEELFKQKIRQVLAQSYLEFCEKNYCRACNSDKKNEYINSINSILSMI